MLETQIRKTIKAFEDKEIEAMTLIDLFLENIGSESSVIRDELIYSNFAQLIMSSQFDFNQLKYIVDFIYKEDLLFKDIDSLSNSVLTRAFTSLLIVLLIAKHKESPYLSNDELEKLINYSLDYMEKEKDNRGFDSEYGWMHAFAHGADLLAVIADTTELDSNRAKRILNVIDRALMTIGDFHFNEEGRLANATYSLLKSGALDSNDFLSWIINNNECNRSYETRSTSWKDYIMALSFTLRIHAYANGTIEQAIMSGLKTYTEHFGCL